MSKAWKQESTGTWVLTVDGTTRGTAVEAIRSPGCWIGNAIGEHSTTATSHKTLKEAQQWVEGELAGTAPAQAEDDSLWTAAHRALALAEGWGVYSFDHDGTETEPRIECANGSDALSYDEEAITHVRLLASAGSKLHQLAIRIHDGEPAEDEEESKERAFQEARAKWKGDRGGLVALCDAIAAGYEAGHTMYDSDMTALAECLTSSTDAIKALVYEARNTLATLPLNSQMDQRLGHALKPF